jgi:hypothetical protein
VPRRLRSETGDSKNAHLRELLAGSNLSQHAVSCPASTPMLNVDSAALVRPIQTRQPASALARSVKY